MATTEKHRHARLEGKRRRKRARRPTTIVVANRLSPAAHEQARATGARVLRQRAARAERKVALIDAGALRYREFYDALHKTIHGHVRRARELRGEAHAKRDPDRYSRRAELTESESRFTSSGLPRRRIAAGRNRREQRDYLRELPAVIRRQVIVARRAERAARRAER